MERTEEAHMISQTPQERLFGICTLRVAIFQKTSGCFDQADTNHWSLGMIVHSQERKKLEQCAKYVQS